MIIIGKVAIIVSFYRKIFWRQHPIQRSSAMRHKKCFLQKFTNCTCLIPKLCSEFCKLRRLTNTYSIITLFYVHFLSPGSLIYNFVDCRYIYYETTNITIDIAFTLMYAAKKYLVAGLVTRCLRTFLKILSADKVYTALEQSMSLEKNGLIAKSPEYIDSHTIRVFSR